MERYCSAVLRAGGEPCAAYSPAPDPGCAGLLLCGGGDLDRSEERRVGKEC